MPWSIRTCRHRIEMVFRAGLAHFSSYLHYVLYLVDRKQAPAPVDPGARSCTKERILGGDEDQAMASAEPPDGLDPTTPLAIARAELAHGERLIWAETSSAASARRRVLPVSLLGWLFLVLTFAWMAKAAIASFWFLILSLPFLLAALALALLPWWWPNVTRLTIYAISDQRLLIIRTWPSRRVTSYGPDDIDVVERKEGKDGSGDLIFRREEHRKLRHHHDPQGKRRVGERAIGFFGVPDVRRLEEAVWALKQKRSVGLADADTEPPQGIDSDPSSDRTKVPAGGTAQSGISTPKDYSP